MSNDDSPIVISCCQWYNGKQGRPEQVGLYSSVFALIAYFVRNTGTMYQIFGYPVSMALNSAGREYEYIYVHHQESRAAKWLKRYGGEETIYTHHRLGPRVLQSQGRIPPYQLGGSFVSQYQEGKKIDGYIYLRHTDITVDRVVIEYPDLFTGRNKIYTSGGSGIYR